MRFNGDGRQRHIVATNIRRTRGRRQKARYHAHGRCLAGAIRAQKPQHLTPIDGEAYPVHGSEFAEAFGQPLNLEHSVHFSCSSLCGYARRLISPKFSRLGFGD